MKHSELTSKSVLYVRKAHKNPKRRSQFIDFTKVRRYMYPQPIYIREADASAHLSIPPLVDLSSTKRRAVKKQSKKLKEKCSVKSLKIS